MDENMEELDNIITLNDENGNEVKFEFLDLIEYNDEEYVVLLPMDSEEDDDGEVVILRLEDTDEDSEEESFTFSILTPKRSLIITNSPEATDFPPTFKEILLS